MGAHAEILLSCVLAATVALSLCASSAKGQSPGPVYNLNVSDPQCIEGPSSASETTAWLAAMRDWRMRMLDKIHYDGSYYARPEFAWTQGAFFETLTMVEDRYLYDPVKRRYTVSRYLADLRNRYGGGDSVIIWPTYPNIGIDDRNTVDMFLSMPGGIAGIKGMVQDFHKAGVRVFFPIHPWDTGTRHPAADWPIVLPKIMAEIGADGLFGDTMEQVPKEYLDNAVAAGHPQVVEPELGLAGDSIDALGWNMLSWGYGNGNPHAPVVNISKWLETRHRVYICDRWSPDKIGMIQFAFFNGIGIETWENVWGIWNQMTDRDCEAVRRVATIERAFPALLASPGWEPFTPTLRPETVFASKWPAADRSQTLLTLVNYGDSAASGEQIEVPYDPALRYYDLWNGVELSPAVRSGKATLSFHIEAHGFGAVLASTRASLPAGFSALLAKMRGCSQRPLSSFSDTVAALPQTMTPTQPTAAASSSPAGMVRIPGGPFRFQVHGVEIEGDDRPGVDVQYPWEAAPGRYHDHVIDITTFYIDKYPVTNAQFKEFLTATHYHPVDSENFLKDWRNNTYPVGWADKPVTWVSIEDARAYAKWAGKRLPHEWEWQYAAQGTDGRIYPWGNEWDDAKVPAPDRGNTLTPPADVTTSSGASPFGVMDLVGNVWQWTDEFADEHTRAAILRGGSYFQPQGSMWYFPQAYRLDEHGKYLLMSPGRDRSGAVGFRCVKDAALPNLKR